ncbi:vitelline membrane protein Vm26Ab-like [Eurosta solidaginis]|uniref:vitelline membrane protein Vm26Ab-like n=1 Tax=Eurosta solidaginis TaxID=178769 RepID=UPI003530854A
MKIFNSTVMFIVITIVGANCANENSKQGMVSSAYGGGSYSSGSSPTYSAPASASAQSTSYGGSSAPSYSAPAAPAPSQSYGGSSSSYAAGAPAYTPQVAPVYTPASYSAPPCPKNYLFSCQPSLSPVGCSSPSSGGYGSAASYSQYVPSYVLPPLGYGY